MKIKLLMDLPLENKYGMVKGRVCKVVRTHNIGRGYARWIVLADDGEEIGVIMHEAEEVYED